MIVIGVMLAARSDGTFSSDLTFMQLPNPNYAVAVRLSDQVREILPVQYLVKYVQPSHREWIVLDSVESDDWCVCDTNALAYVLIGEDSCYFVVSRLSPTPRRDTFLSVPQNGAGSLLCGIGPFEFSLRSATLAFQRQIDDSTFQTVIGTLDRKKNEFHRIRTIDRTMNVMTSYDFTEFIVTFDVIDKRPSAMGPRNYLGIYNASTDSLHLLSNITGYNYQPLRHNRQSPLFYEKRLQDGPVNLWKWTLNKGEELVTHLDSTESVWAYRMVGDSIVAFAGTKNGSTRAIVIHRVDRVEP